MMKSCFSLRKFLPSLSLISPPSKASRAEELDELFPIINPQAKPTANYRIFVSIIWKQLNHLGNVGFDPAMFRVDPYGNVIYLHADAASPLAWDIDHWFPCSRGGLTVPSNLRILQWNTFLRYVGGLEQQLLLANDHLANNSKSILAAQKLPQYPLPTHDLVLRGVIPTEFEINTVAYNEGHTVKLENKLFLGDAISDMPEVTNAESRDEIPYSCAPKTEFQRFIRMTKDGQNSGDGTC